MARVQTDEEDALSVELARRLQHEYDQEGGRGQLIDEQRRAYEATMKQDWRGKRANEAAKQSSAKKATQAAAQEATQAAAQEAAQAAAQEAAQAAAQEAAQAAQEEEKPPSMEELRRIRIKAFSTPTAN